MDEDKYLDLDGLSYYHGKLKPKLDEIDKLREDVGNINSNIIRVDDIVILNCGDSVITEK